MERRLPYIYVADPVERARRLVEDEIDQSRQEGRDVTEIESRFRAPGEKSLQELMGLCDELEQKEPSATFPYEEPSDLEAIRAARPGRPIELEVSLRDGELRDRIHGGWLGRCAGNLLGRPVENSSREEIETLLSLTGDYPLSDYFPVVSPVPDEAPQWVKDRLARQGEAHDRRGVIDHMVRDDDLDYTILGLHILERRGPQFTTGQVGDAWLMKLPFKEVHTAERVAFINLVNFVLPPDSARKRNPYREWIGAMIRADAFGYVCPGRPDLASELAHRDASLSHRKNGIYGEMFAAAMIAAAFATKDPLRVVDAGLSVIPARSRLAEAVRNVVEWSSKAERWEDTWSRVMERWGHYHCVHTINNAAMITLALLHGKGDFARSITTGVMCGLDTDCTGATIGSIMGVMCGARALPKRWIKPIDDRIESCVVGFDNSSITDLASRTFIQAKGLQR